MIKLKHFAFLSTLFIFIVSCGVQTPPPSDTDRNGNTVINGTNAAGFSTVTKTVQTTGSYYYSFEGLLHSSCDANDIYPVCVTVAKQAQCDIGIPGCYSGTSGTYTYYEQVNYVNECSWREANSPSATYMGRPCSY